MQCNNDVCYDHCFTWRNHTFSAGSSPVCCRVVDLSFSEHMNSLVPSVDKKEWARPGICWFAEDSVFCLWGLGSRILCLHTLNIFDNQLPQLFCFE